jgi:alkylhydroperoxidase family enzyme
MLAHGGVLASQFYDEQRVVQIVADRSTADLDETDRAVMDLAAKVAADATSVSAEDVGRLKRLGRSDAEIFDVVAAAAARAFLTKVIDGLGFQPDSAYAELAPELRDALVIGRPIETA